MNEAVLQELIKFFRERNAQEHLEDSVNYNIFYVLRVWKKEVVLHSRMIVDLLNPKGYHGMGAKPLQLFIEMLKVAVNVDPNMEQLNQSAIEFDFNCEPNVAVIDEQLTDDNRRIEI